MAKYNYEYVRCPEYKTRIIVDTKREFLYCPIPKAANTAWKFLLAQEPPPDIAKLHEESQSFQFLSSIDGKDFDAIKDRLFKFIFVRNPLTRLLSTYKNKFENLSMRPEYDRLPFWVDYAFYLKQRVIALGADESAGEDLTFREFVSFVCSQEFSQMDEHWHPQFLMSCQSMLRYDFVGRFEDLTAGVEFVCRRLGITKSFPTHDEISFPPTHATEQVDQYYDARLLDMVREKFEVDFRHYEY